MEEKPLECCVNVEVGLEEQLCLREVNSNL